MVLQVVHIGLISSKGLLPNFNLVVAIHHVFRNIMKEIKSSNGREEKSTMYVRENENIMLVEY